MAPSAEQSASDLELKMEEAKESIRKAEVRGTWRVASVELCVICIYDGHCPYAYTLAYLHSSAQ